jgi:hypothetical protein
MTIKEGIRRLGRLLGSGRSAAEYIDLESFRQDLFSKNADPEYRRRVGALLDELKLRFGDRIPVTELGKYIAGERADLKTRMKGIIERARAEGKAVSLEQLRQRYEKAKAEYEGPDPEGFNKEIDRTVEGLRAQYGEHIPAVELFKILQDLEHATGQTETVHQFPLSDWSAQPGFHERKLLVRYNNVFFTNARRGVSERELCDAKTMDAQMFKRFEDAALPTIGFFVGLKNQNQNFAIGEIDKVREQVDETITNGSGLGARAHELLRMLKAGAMRWPEKLKRLSLG